MDNLEKTERLEFLVLTKSFDDLTVEEREFVLTELGSAEQFNALRQLNYNEKFTEKILPDERILKDLQRRLADARQNSSTFSAMLFGKVPVAALYMLIFIAAAVIYFTGSENKVIEPVKTIVQIDTVLVTPAADTVYVDRVIYKTRVIRVIEKAEEVKVTSKGDKPSESINMEEKAELVDLLVSGS